MPIISKSFLMPLCVCVCVSVIKNTYMRSMFLNFLSEQYSIVKYYVAFCII